VNVFHCTPFIDQVRRPREIILSPHMVSAPSPLDALASRRKFYTCGDRDAGRLFRPRSQWSQM